MESETGAMYARFEALLRFQPICKCAYSSLSGSHGVLFSEDIRNPGHLLEFDITDRRRDLLEFEYMLRPQQFAGIRSSFRGYRIKFLRDFNKKEPELRKVPTKWKGRIQWWKDPIYVAPHVNILQKGVDFTFQDGRPVYITSADELQRKKEQIELGKQIVKLLDEVNEAEEMHRRRLEAEKEENERRHLTVPFEKGAQEIS